MFIQQAEMLFKKCDTDDILQRFGHFYVLFNMFRINGQRMAF